MKNPLLLLSVLRFRNAVGANWPAVPGGVGMQSRPASSLPTPLFSIQYSSRTTYCIQYSIKVKPDPLPTAMGSSANASAGRSSHCGPVIRPRYRCRKSSADARHLPVSGLSAHGSGALGDGWRRSGRQRDRCTIRRHRPALSRRQTVELLLGAEN